MNTSWRGIEWRRRRLAAAGEATAVAGLPALLLLACAPEPPVDAALERGSPVQGTVRSQSLEGEPRAVALAPAEGTRSASTSTPGA